MATKQLNTRIQLRYDTYENWLKSSLVLEQGEVGFAVVTADITTGIPIKPTVLFKVGDGNRTFANLDWPAAKAGDVYEWAKAAAKPSYKADEITGIDAYIANYVEDQMGISVDTDTQYQIVKVDDYNYKFQTKGKTDVTWADSATIVIPNDTEAIAAALKAGQDAAAAVNTEKERAMAAEQANATAAANAQAAAEAAQGDVDDLAELVGTLPEGVTATTVVGLIEEKTAGLSNDLGERVGNIEKDYLVEADKTELAGLINTEKGRIDGIVADYLKEEDKTELANLINTEKGRLDILVGDDAGKSARTIANEELAAKLIPADAAESLNTLQEIADWIQDHPGDAAAMNSAIEALQDKVDTGDKKVSEYVSAAITALNIGSYALASDLTALAARVEAMEAKVPNWDAAEKNAKDYAKEYADGLNTAMDTRVKAVEEKKHEHANKALLDTYTQTEANLADAVAKKHEHANADELAKIVSGDKAKWDDAAAKAHEHGNKTVIDAITAEKVAAWDAAEGNAKGYTDTEIGKLHAIAKSGNVNDLVQTTGDTLWLVCGTSAV